MFAARFRVSLIKILSLSTLAGLSACQSEVKTQQSEIQVEKQNKIDLLFAVDASTLRDANRGQIEASIEKIVDELEADGKDVRYAIIAAGSAAQASTPSAGVGNSQATPGVDLFSNLLGIFGGNQFLGTGWSSGLPSTAAIPLPVSQGYTQLFPLLSQITAMTGQGQSSSSILTSLLPVFSQIMGQQIGGGSQSNMLNQQLLQQLIASAVSGQQNGMNQNEILMALAPQLLQMLQGGGAIGGSQNNMAAVLLPTLLRLFSQSQNGGKIDETQIASLVLPILMGQLGGSSGGNQPLQLLGFIFPLLQQFTGMDSGGMQNLAVALAPLAVSYFSGGSGAQYAPLVQAMIPMLFQMMGNGQNSSQIQDSMQLLGTPAISSILSAFSQGGPLADNFFRPESLFSIVYLGDPMNVGDSTQASALAHTFLQNFMSLSGRGLENFSFNSISLNGSSACAGSASGNAVVAALLSQRTDGVATDMCDLASLIAGLSR